MNIRKAKIKDVPFIHTLINESAKESRVLPRALSYIYENIRDFWIAEEEAEIVGCVSLHIVWEDLAEIKSLVVRKDFQNKSLGAKLMQNVLEEAKFYEVEKVFILTNISGFFLKFGFKFIDKSRLPHKIWSECINCPRFPDCDEEAMIKELS